MWSGSAPSAVAVAALLYLAAHGARAPFLALLGLRRLPNLVVIMAPYAVGVPLALIVSERVDTATGEGLVAVALAPGALVAPGLVSAAGGRRSDLAGALLLGTLVLSFVLLVTWPTASLLALTGAQAFVVASLAAGAMPQVRDRMIVPIRWAGGAAGLVVVALAVAGSPAIGMGAIIAALAGVLVMLVVAGLAAVALRRDVLSAVGAAGTRDPIVAIALARATGGAEATAVPLVTAAILGIAAAALLLRRR